MTVKVDPRKWVEWEVRDSYPFTRCIWNRLQDYTYDDWETSIAQGMRNLRSNWSMPCCYVDHNPFGRCPANRQHTHPTMTCVLAFKRRQVNTPFSLGPSLGRHSAGSSSWHKPKKFSSIASSASLRFTTPLDTNWLWDNNHRHCRSSNVCSMYLKRHPCNISLGNMAI